MLVTGRSDVSGPPDIAWHLARAWLDVELVLLDDAGHGFGLIDAVVAAIDRVRPSAG